MNILESENRLMYEANKMLRSSNKFISFSYPKASMNKQ